MWRWGISTAPRRWAVRRCATPAARFAIRWTNAAPKNPCRWSHWTPPEPPASHLTGPLARLTDPAAVCDADDYIWATLTDDAPIPDAMARLRSAYPNAMKLDYAPRSAPAGAAPAAEAVRRRTFSELVVDFFRTAQSREPTQAELDALEQLREEVDACGR
mgnify:CR=1 FL=1